MVQESMMAIFSCEGGIIFMDWEFEIYLNEPDSGIMGKVPQEREGVRIQLANRVG